MIQNQQHSGGIRSAPSSAFVPFLAFLLWGFGCSGYEIEIREYDFDRAYNGYTYFSVWSAGRIIAVDMDGTTLWNSFDLGKISMGTANGFRYIEEESLVVCLRNEKPMAVRTDDYEVVFDGKYDKAHHSVLMTPERTIMYLARERIDGIVGDFWSPEGCLLADVIKEIEMDTKEIIWEWHLIDHLDPTENHASQKSFLSELHECPEWAHGNSIKFIPNYSYQGNNYSTVLYNARFLDTFWMIDYASGDVLWSCGQHGTFGRRESPEEVVFSATHEVDIVTDDTFIMYDNGSNRSSLRSRALKISVDPLTDEVAEIWSWRHPDMYDWWGGDADELPNGNVLIANTTQGRIIEVTPEGEIVWDMRIGLNSFTPHSVYQLQRVPY